MESAAARHDMAPLRVSRQFLCLVGYGCGLSSPALTAERCGVAALVSVGWACEAFDRLLEGSCH